MNDKVEKFDPSKLMEGVKDRIKATFVSLVPDDQWENLVKKEVDAFFDDSNMIEIASKDLYKSGSFHSTKMDVASVNMSPFRFLVWEHCSNMTITILKEKISKEYFNDKWSPNAKDLDEKMKGLIKETAPVAMLNFFEAITVKNVQYLRNEIMNY